MTDPEFWDHGQVGIVVRRIHPREGRRLRDVRLRALADTPFAFGSSYGAEVARPPAFWQARAHSGSTGRESATFVAESGRRLVGLVGAYRPAQGEPPELVSMWVATEVRGQGVGDRLVRSVLDWAIHAGDRHVDLWVAKGNNPAVVLYQRMGFVTTGDCQASPYDPGWEVIRMRWSNARDADLAAYYDQDAGDRQAREIDRERVARRDEFISLLRQEGRSSLVEIGVGPGRDAVAFMAAGLSVAGVDLSSEHVRRSREVGVDARLASAMSLPFADASFSAGWTMSTLLHVPDAEIDDALSEILRVLVPGAPLAIGLWGGFDREGPNEEDTLEPKRFFSHRSHERVKEILGRHGRLERFETWGTLTATAWVYQWCLLRT